MFTLKAAKPIPGPEPSVRFACLHHGDPVSESLWSGIPLNIVRTLRELGHEVVPVGNLEPKAPFYARLKTAFYRRVLHRQYLMNRDPGVIKLRARDGNRKLAAIGPVDAVLITYPPNAAFVETPYPVLILHDAAWADLIDYYPGHETKTLAAETIKGGLILDEKALNRCDHAIYCSHWAKRGLVRHYGIALGKLSVASLGASFVKAPTRDDLTANLRQRGREPMQLLFIGKEWHRKGGEIAVQVAAEIERRGVPVELHVVGCQPDGDTPAFVRRHGYLNKDIPGQAADLLELFSSCDFFLMPTRAEASGIVFAESAAFGVPVMATNTGGVPEVARPEWSFTPAPGTAATAYADWAIAMFKDRQAYERASWLAREAYEREFNWPSFCQHLVGVVADLKAKGS